MSRNAYCCILSMCSYSRPAKGRTAKIGNLSGTRNSATRFFRKKSRADGLSPGDAPRSRFACAKVRTSRRTRKRGEDFFQDGETGSDARRYETPRYDELKNVKKKKRDRHPPLKTKKARNSSYSKKQIHIIIYKTILTHSNNITIRIVKKSLLYIHFSSIKTILNDFEHTHSKVFQSI